MSLRKYKVKYENERCKEIEFDSELNYDEHVTELDNKNERNTFLSLYLENNRWMV